MQSGWCRGRNVTGYAYKILAVIITTAIFCSGCRTDTPGNNSTAVTERADAVTEQAAEENISAEDIKDRENGEEPRQHVWGTWTVMAAWDPETGWEREYCRLLDSAYRLRPDRLYATGRQTDSFPVRYDWAFSAELDGIYGSIVSTDYLKYNYEIRTLDADYCLRIRTEWEECTSYGEWRLFSFLYLTGEKEMVGVYSGTAYLLEKTKDYDGTGTVIPESGTICGEWEVTDVPETGTADEGRKKRQRLSIAAENLEPETFGKFYSAGTGDVPDGGFAEKAGLEPGDFSAVCEFTDGFGWNRIVLKDRITAVLEKDGKFYRAEKNGAGGGYSPADMNGWEYTGEKRLPVWGTWKVTGQCAGDRVYTDCDEMGDTYQILPDKITYREKNRTGSAELKSFHCQVVSPEYVVEIYGPDRWKGNCILNISIDSDTEVISGDEAPYLDLYLEEDNKMVRKIARYSYLLEKIRDYDGSDEDAGFTVGTGMFHGGWKITGVLRTDKEDADTLIGEYLSIEDRHEMEAEMEDRLVRDFYVAGREDPSVRKLVDAMEINEDPLIYIYEFREDFYWDKMIIKDEDTAVVEKDGDFYWVERRSGLIYPG